MRGGAAAARFFDKKEFGSGIGSAGSVSVQHASSAHLFSSWWLGNRAATLRAASGEHHFQFWFRLWRSCPFVKVCRSSWNINKKWRSCNSKLAGERRIVRWGCLGAWRAQTSNVGNTRLSPSVGSKKKVSRTFEGKAATIKGYLDCDRRAIDAAAAAAEGEGRRKQSVCEENPSGRVAFPWSVTFAIPLGNSLTHMKSEPPLSALAALF